MSTLPGEMHSLPLHLAAITATSASVAVTFLGANTPIEAIADSVLRAKAKGIALTSSVFAAPKATESSLQKLKSLLPKKAKILLGGSGFSLLADKEGHTYFEDFQSFYDHLVDW
jgi:hypothetical protein